MNLAFLIDVSDSMNGERLEAVKRTLRSVRTLFQPEDQATLVTFGETATTLANHLTLDAAGVEQFYQSVEAMTTNGCTNLSAGLERLLELGTYDMALILTDGNINAGLTSTVGLRAMAQGLGRMPFHMLGYGADHNHQLLQGLALSSRGSYIYIDSEEILPIALGDILAGLRTQVARDARIVCAGAGWACQELGSAGPEHTIGSLVPDRDFWAVFRGTATDPLLAIHLATEMGHMATLEAAAIQVGVTPECTEQVLRCRVASLLTRLAEGSANRTDVKNMDNEIQQLSEELARRPLICRLRGQVAEALTNLQDHARMTNHEVARFRSGAVYLGNQRGVMSQIRAAPAAGVAGGPVLAAATLLQTFSSPLQVRSSQAAHETYDADSQ